MEITFFGNGLRGLVCLKRLIEEKYSINCVVVHKIEHNPIAEFAQTQKIQCVAPQDPNEADQVEFFQSLNSDVFVLSGYGKIFKTELIDVPKKMCINTHGGKLPAYRGSSPLNWAIINGEQKFTLSVIRLSAGVDAGDILAEKEFSLLDAYTIKDIHKIAAEQFPQMIVWVLEKVKNNSAVPKPQATSGIGYYPLRSSDDGLILWDVLTAKQIHNRVRALAEPYCSFTFYRGKKIKLVNSEMTPHPHYGDPGKIYQINAKGILICASDQCLRITEAYEEETGKPLAEMGKRYDRMATVRWAAVERIAL